MYLMHQTAISQPKYGRLIFLGPGTLFNRAIDKLLVILCQLGRQGASQRQDAGRRLPGSKPGKVLLICGKNPFLDFTNFIEVPVVCEGLNDLRHTAYIAVQLQQVGIVTLKYGGHVKVAPL